MIKTEFRALKHFMYAFRITLGIDHIALYGLCNTFLCFMDWSMPMVNQDLDRLILSLWISFVRGACISSSFVILSRNFLYDILTSYFQSENKSVSV